MSAIQVRITRKRYGSVIEVDGKYVGQLSDGNTMHAGNVSEVVERLLELLGVENVIVMTCREDLVTRRLSPLTE